MTKQEFINHELDTWGEDEVFALLDKGFEPIQLLSQIDGNVEVKWTWRLTNGANCGRLSTGGNPTFLPFRRVARI